MKTGQTCFKNGITYINNIEPKPEVKLSPLSEDFSRDTRSIWIGMEIIPKDKFEENMDLYKELCNWSWDALYIMRFLLNLNLKARIFFHIENNNSSYSFQNTLNPYCSTGSSFNIKFNRYDLVIPLLKKLLQYGSTNELKALMYNHAVSNKGYSAVIHYFYSFAVFEGIIHCWSEYNGYSELWGSAIATLEEQEELHKNLRTLFKNFLKQNSNKFDKKKKNQLDSLINAYFPLDRRIRLSLSQRFKSYFMNRLSEEMKEIEPIRLMKKRLRRIYQRRNEIGHSIRTHASDKGFTEDIDILLSTIKYIMNDELNKFLEGEEDWKFQERKFNLVECVSPLISKKVLDKFYFDIKETNQSNIRLIERSKSTRLKALKYNSKIILSDSRTKFESNLKIFFPFAFKLLRSEIPKNKMVLETYENPEWWLFTSQDNSQWLFKVLPPIKITTSLAYPNDDPKKFADIPSENIIGIFKFNSMEIPNRMEKEIMKF